MRKFRTEYHEARTAAQQTSNELKMLVRLRRVTEYGQPGYVFNLVPCLDRQFGRDLEGELFTPEETD